VIGSLRAADAAVVRADDSAFCEARGCYTSVRIRAGVPRFRRTGTCGACVRDAAALGLPAADPRRLRRALWRARRGGVLRRRGRGAALAVGGGDGLHVWAFRAASATSRRCGAR